MKKLLFVISIFLLFHVGAKAQTALGAIPLTTLVANYDTTVVPAPSDPQAVTVSTNTRFLHYTGVNGNFTINLTNTAHRRGNMVWILIESDATPRTVTFGTGFKTSTSTLVTTSSKDQLLLFICNGTNYCEAFRGLPIDH